MLLKLTTENTFVFTSNFYKQTDGWTMGGSLSVIFSDIHMAKTECEVVNPSKPKFLSIGEINLMTYFRNLTATIQT